MAYHFQYRFTPAPKGMPVITTPLDLSGIMLLKFDKLAIGYETKDKRGNDVIPHYHIYGETDYKEDSIRVKLRDILHIPKTSQGKGNAYSSLEFNRYQQPSPAYVVKWGNVVATKGYTEDEIQKYIDEGKTKFLRLEVRSEVIMNVPGGEAAGNKTLLDQFLEYMEEVLPKEKNETFTIDALKRQSIRYWRSKCPLLPVKSTQQRFITSAWLEWTEVRRRSITLGILELEEKNLM